jgi:hypothetical protein
MEPKQEIDIWEGMLRQRQRELMREGKPEQDAEDQALAEIRRQIRNS